MNFSWFRKKPDPLLERAENLINAASILGIGSYTDFSADLSIVNKIDTEQWDWVFTIAGVFVADTRLNTDGLEASRKQQIHDLIMQKLASWKPDGLGGLHDCKAFFERTYESLAKMNEYRADPQFLSSDCLGAWMVWNLLGHAPESEDERKLSRMAGAFVTRSFVDWWKIT
jgi:hypothetical protein